MTARRKPSRPYLDRGKPGTLRYDRGILPTVPDPPAVRGAPLSVQALRRHNTMEPELEETHRILLRWSETEGSGLSNPDAETREMHYDPLPLELQERVSAIVASSKWRDLIHRFYFGTLTQGSLADQLGISRAQLNNDRRAALWFFKGRFESERIPMLAAPKRARAAKALW